MDHCPPSPGHAGHLLQRQVGRADRGRPVHRGGHTQRVSRNAFVLSSSGFTYFCLSSAYEYLVHLFSLNKCLISTKTKHRRTKSISLIFIHNVILR